MNHRTEKLLFWVSRIIAGVAGAFAGAAMAEDYIPLTRAEPVVRMVLQEAANEPFIGLVAVAGVALDRTYDQRWPGDRHSVVYQRYQFSGMLLKLRRYSPEQIERARLAVSLAEQGRRPCGKVLWYHTVHIDPEWRHGLQASCLIGEHVFYEDVRKGP